MSQSHCVINITAQGRARRRRGGMIMMTIAIVLGTVLVVMEIERVWRLSVAIPLLLAGFGLFQAREKT